MKLENQVVTLIQAKRLKELGVNGRTQFVIIEMPDSSIHEPRSIICNTNSGLHNEPGMSWYYAPTVAELGVMLPWQSLNPIHNTPRANGTQLQTSGVWPTGQDWAPWAMCPAGSHQPHFYESEAKSRAALLIHFLETRKVTAEEINACLNQS